MVQKHPPRCDRHRHNKVRSLVPFLSLFVNTYSMTSSYFYFPFVSPSSCPLYWIIISTIFRCVALSTSVLPCFFFFFLPLWCPFHLPQTLNIILPSLHLASITWSVTSVCCLQSHYSPSQLTQQLVSELVPVCVSGGNRWHHRAHTDLTVSLSLQLTSGLFEMLLLSLRLL